MFFRQVADPDLAADLIAPFCLERQIAKRRFLFLPVFNQAFLKRPPFGSLRKLSVFPDFIRQRLS
jgi:hypothetical protein